MRILTLSAATAAAALLGAAAYAQTSGPATVGQPPNPEGTAQDQANETSKLPPAGSETVTVTRRTVAEPAPADNDTAAMPPPPESAAAPSASTMGTDVAATEPVATTTQVVANAPIPDTAENRRKYGGPESNGGKRTKARGN